MIQVDPTTYDAESTDIATRVNVATTIEDQITIRLGDEDDGFVAGDFIEFMNEGPAVVVFDVKGFTTTITVDQETGPVATLQPMQRCVAYYVGPDDYQWDIHTSQGVNQSTAFMFQVGVPAGGHIHAAFMSVKQAKDLIHGTKNQIPVADPLQPSVVLRSFPNSESGDPLHFHELTVFFDYLNHTFIVTNISNNALDNHAASLIGDGAGAAGGESPTYVFEMETGSPGDFSGSLLAGWNPVFRKDQDPQIDIVFDVYTGGFTIEGDGMYEISVSGSISASSGNLPSGTVSYGVDLELTNADFVDSSTSWHTLHTDSGLAMSSPPASLAAGRVTLNDRFMVGMRGGVSGVKPYVYSYSYNSSGDGMFARIVVTFKRVGPYQGE